MCDCYDHTCKLCDVDIPMHLGDFETGSDEIDVFCKYHIPTENVRVYTLTDSNEGSFPVGYRIGIRDLTENARARKDENHPNLDAYWTVVEL